MGLNISSGNMYEFVTHTWNTIKGKCPHGCTYCYMKRWKNQREVRFDEKEMKTDLGQGNFIFVGSSCDMFAENIPNEWIMTTINRCLDFPNNKYLFQSKNPSKFRRWAYPVNTSFCTTIETNREYTEIMKEAPIPLLRAFGMNYMALNYSNYLRYVTVEPIMDFDIHAMVDMIYSCKPNQVNIGADSGRNNLPEPSPGKVLELVKELEQFTKVVRKKNLGRLMKG